MSYQYNTEKSNAFAQSMRATTNIKVVPGGKGEGMVESTAPIHTYNASLQSTLKEDYTDRYHQAYLYAKKTNDPQYLINLNIALLQKRRIRNGGGGLRDHFHNMIVYIYKTYEDQREFIISLVPYFPHIGYFRDYWAILHKINAEVNNYSNEEQFYNLFNPLVQSIVNSYLSYLRKDEKELHTHTHSDKQPQLSLAAKYFPRPKKSEDREIWWMLPIKGSDGGKKLFHRRSLTHFLTIAYLLPENLEGVTHKQISDKENPLVPHHIQKKMRETYTALSKQLDVPEIKFSSTEERWSELKLEEMTSRCFMRHLQALKNKMNKKGQKHEDRYPYSEDRIKCAENTQKYLSSGNIKQGSMDVIDLTRRILNSQIYESDVELEAIYQTLITQTLKDVILFYADLNMKANDKEAECENPIDTTEFYKNLDELETLRKKTPPNMEEIQVVVDKLKQTPFLQDPKLLEEYYKSIKGKKNEEQQYELLEIARLFVKGVLPMMDVSGSMTVRATQTASCMDICVALGVLFTYVNPGPFRDLAISFTDIPQMFNFENMTVKQRLNKVFQHVGYNTNLEKAMRLILKTAIDNNIGVDELPDLVIFSDGNFDQMMGYDDLTWSTAFQKYKKLFQESGYELPQIYFWNLNGAQRNFQAHPNREGVSQLNDFTPSCFQQILTGDRVLDTLDKTPEEEGGTKREKSAEDDFQGMVNQSYWDFVRLLASNCNEGLYSSYNYEVTEEVIQNHSLVLDMLATYEPVAEHEVAAEHEVVAEHEAPRPASAPPAVDLPEPEVEVEVKKDEVKAESKSSYWPSLW